MDRLSAIQLAIGQPLRPEDWIFIQDSTKLAIANLVKGLTNTNTFILWGVMIVPSGGGFTVTEGAIYTDGEIFYVPAATFTTHEEWVLYLVKNFTTDEPRTFKDTTEHDVWELRRCALGYAGSVPTGGIAYIGLPTLAALHTQILYDLLGPMTALVSKASLIYTNEFSAATSFGYAKLIGNGLNQFMLMAAFTADVESGLLTTLPEAYWPTGDLVGFFQAPGKSTAYLAIKKNGEVWVYNCAIRATNYITFSFPINFDDKIVYDVPTSEGME